MFSRNLKVALCGYPGSLSLLSWLSRLILAISLLLELRVGAAFFQTSSAKFRKLYSDDRIRLSFPANWTSQPVYTTTSGDRVVKLRIGVVLSDGPFELYLLTHYGQASGVIGGRFSEVAPYVVPWLKSDEPWACLDVFRKRLIQAIGPLMRVDLLLDRGATLQNNDLYCAELARRVRHRVWAGAYFGFLSRRDAIPGFFLNAPLSSDLAVPDKQMVFAATVRAQGPESLPKDNSEHLKTFLSEADQVVAGIVYDWK